MNWLKEKTHFIFDLDGTLILGNQILPHSREILKTILDAGKTFTIVTNNSSRSIDNYFRYLTHLGFPVDRQHIHTSGKATAQYLSRIKSNPSVYLLGTRALIEDFTSYDIVCVNEIDAEPVDFVVLGFDQELSYKRIVEASLLIRRGIPFIATHADINIPTEKGLLPDCGAMIALFEKSTGVAPKVIGKPSIEMIAPILASVDDPSKVVMIGDRLYTDMEMAQQAGIDSILVHTGETTKEMLFSSGFEPTAAIDSLLEMNNFVSAEKKPEPQLSMHRL